MITVLIEAEKALALFVVALAQHIAEAREHIVEYLLIIVLRE